jgi:hypothetical protein
MKGFLVRFLLLFLLLPGGYGQLQAHADTLSCQAPSETSLHASVAAEQKSQVLVINDASGKKAVFRIDVTEVKEQEEDEHESSSFRKNLKKVDSYFAALYAHGLRYSSAGGKRASFFYQHCSYFSSYRYILLQVFRI